MGGRRLAGRVVETEAYMGPGDLASHARSGPRGRAGIMYGPPGYAYVYLVYGVHYCFNAVTESSDFPAAVLVRAVEPLDGATGRRASGPGLVCRALEIDRRCNGLDLTDSPLYVESGEPVSDARVRVGARIGVHYAGTWAEKPWRFWVSDSPHVSRRVGGQVFEPGMLAGSGS